MNQISQIRRVNRSRHTGRPILQELNTIYGYYATIKFLGEEEYQAMLKLPPYEGPVHEAEARYETNRHIV